MKPIPDFQLGFSGFGLFFLWVSTWDTSSYNSGWSRKSYRCLQSYASRSDETQYANTKPKSICHGLPRIMVMLDGVEQLAIHSHRPSSAPTEYSFLAQIRFHFTNTLVPIVSRKEGSTMHYPEKSNWTQSIQGWIDFFLGRARICHSLLPPFSFPCEIALLWCSFVLLLRSVFNGLECEDDRDEMWNKEQHFLFTTQ